MSEQPNAFPAYEKSNIEDQDRMLKQMRRNTVAIREQNERILDRAPERQADEPRGVA